MTKYICMLPKEIQFKILTQLNSMDFSAREIEIAMNSRLCDLEETIDMEEIL